MPIKPVHSAMQPYSAVVLGSTGNVGRQIVNLQAALRSIDPKKNPEDYAAVKAELERSLPAFESCLDVAALRKLDAVVQPSTDSKAVIVVAALGATGYLVWRLLNHSYETPEIYWEHAAVVMVVVAVLWVRRAMEDHR
jgi:hypothetical protein